MKGIEIARDYYCHCRPILEHQLPAIMEAASDGLAGEGSECFGMDDAISRDHDFGPAFCLWLPERLLQTNTHRINNAFAMLTKEFEGYRSRFESSLYGMRIGPVAVEAYFYFFTGLRPIPNTLQEWLAIPEYNLAAATNDDIFANNCGLFNAWRNALLAYYPHDVFLKKLAARCMQMSQSGQYNLPRCMKREDAPGSLLAMARFMESALSLVFMLNKSYMPFYKWAPAKARSLPILGKELTCLLDYLTLFSPLNLPTDKSSDLIEQFCQSCAAFLYEFSGKTTSWLWEHGPAITSNIQDKKLKKMNLLQA